MPIVSLAAVANMTVATGSYMFAPISGCWVAAAVLCACVPQLKLYWFILSMLVAGTNCNEFRAIVPAAAKNVSN